MYNTDTIYDYAFLIFVVVLVLYGTCIQIRDKRIFDRTEAHEPVKLRALNSYEISFLKEKIKYLTIAIVALFLLFPLSLYMLSITQITNTLLGTFVIMFMTIAAFTTLPLILFLSVIAYRFHQDLDEPLYEVKGSVFLRGAFVPSGYNMTTIMYVGRVKFTYRYWLWHVNEISETMFKLRSNDEVEVVYSPASKHIWRMKKIS